MSVQDTNDEHLRHTNRIRISSTRFPSNVKYLTIEDRGDHCESKRYTIHNILAEKAK
jgi:hypothetical protein